MGVQATIGKPEVLKPGGAATPKAAAGRTSVPGGATYTGQLTTWSGTMGWIAPMDTISHPLFKGKIYLKGSDVLSKAGVAEGAILTFSLYTDSQGLGAENCKLADDTGGPEILKPKTKAASVVADADSTVLKAKPKASSIVADADSSVLKAKPKMSADSGSASVLKAKPKMSAGGASKPGAPIAIPGHLSPALAERLVAWMWDRGG